MSYRNNDPLTLIVLAGGGIGLLAVVIAIADYESPTDVDRKPYLIQEIVENSETICERPSTTDQRTAYTEALEDVLGDVKSKELDVFVEKDITVCLDARLWDMDTGLIGREPKTLFYGGEHPVMSIGYDLRYKNGHYDGKFSSYADNLLEDFASKARKNPQILRSTQLQFGYTYYQSTGKSGYTNTKWDSASGTNFIKRQPELKTPPAKF